MAGERTVKVKFVGDPSGVQRASSDATAAVNKFGHGAQQATAAAGKAGQAATVPSSAIGSWQNLAVAAAGAWAAMQVGQQVWDAIEAAGSLSAAIGTTEQIFGASAGAVKAWAQTASDSLGQSNRAALVAANGFATFAKAAGLSQAEAVGFSQGLVGLASDLAAFRDTSPEEAIVSISAALRGENDPIEKYGILLNDAITRQKAFELGLISTTANALTPQQRILAVQALLYEQTADAQGQFARESDQLGTNQAKLTAKWEDAQAALGQALLPAATKAVTVLGDLAMYVQRNHDWLVPLIGVLGGMVGILLTVAAAVKVWTIAQGILNVVLVANPIGLIIAAIFLLIAGIALIVIGIKKLGVDWSAVWQGITDAASAAWDWIRGVWDDAVAWVAGLPGRVATAAVGLFDGFKNAFKGAINWIIRTWNGLEFTIPGFDVFGAHVNGVTVGVPDIPEIRDSGGPAVAGRPYWIGLNRRPELFVPGQSGRILTQEQAQSAVAPAAVDVNVYLDGELLDVRTDARIVRHDQATRRWVRQARAGAAA